MWDAYSSHGPFARLGFAYRNRVWALVLSGFKELVFLFLLLLGLWGFKILRAFEAFSRLKHPENPIPLKKEYALN